MKQSNRIKIGFKCELLNWGRLQPVTVTEQNKAKKTYYFQWDGYFGGSWYTARQARKILNYIKKNKKK